MGEHVGESDPAGTANAADEAAINAYLGHLQTQRKLSAHTIDNYRRDLVQLCALSQKAGRPSIAGLSHFDIRRFTSQLHAQGLSAPSIARKLSAWRGFYHWLAEHQPMESNPVTGVKAPKRAKSLPKALGVDDAVRLVSGTAVQEADLPEAVRLCNRAMFELLYSSGLRVSELTSLDTHYVQQAGHVSAGWVDIAGSELTVTGKGNKRRSVPVGSAALDALRAWLAVRPGQGKNAGTGAGHSRDSSTDSSTDSSAASKAAGTPLPEDAYALFVTARGKRMTPRVVQARIKQHAQALGIPVDVHPHVLRHSFASHVLQSSGDLRAVQEMLGHASIASTQVYTSLDFQRLAQVYDAAHPRAKKQETE